MRCSLYQPRTYRQVYKSVNTNWCRVCEGESDLFVFSDVDITENTREHLITLRRQLAQYIRKYPVFAECLHPVSVDNEAPDLVQNMARTTRRVGIGPMAAVAGAISEALVREIRIPGHDMIVENGGDIFACSAKPLTVALYAGTSPLSMKLGLTVQSADDGVGICTSSGSVGHSLSFGKADAVTVVARKGALADAVATACGNRVQHVQDIDRVLEYGIGIQGVLGVVIILEHHLGIRGDRVELCSVSNV